MYCNYLKRLGTREFIWTKYIAGMKPFKGVVIIYEEGGVVNGENKD
jgi:hypothetical protein